MSEFRVQGDTGEWEIMDTVCRCCGFRHNGQVLLVFLQTGLCQGCGLKLASTHPQFDDEEY